MDEEPRVPDRTHLTLWRAAEATAAMLVLGFFLFSLRGVLTPPLLFLLLWAVLIPFRGMPGHSALVAIAGALTLAWLLSTTGSLLAPFVLALILAYVLDPLVDKLEGLKMPRALAILLLTLPALGVLALLILIMVPAAIAQLGSAFDGIPLFFQRMSTWLQTSEEWLLRVDIPLIDEEGLVEQLRSVDSAAALAFLQERQEALAGGVLTGVLGLGRGIGSVLTILGYVFLTPVLTYYLLRDWDRLTKGVAELIPHDHRDGVVSFAIESDYLLSRYFRGQVTVAIAVGTITGLGLAIARFPQAATLGLIVAIFSVVPYLGLVLSLVPAVFIALVSFEGVGLSLLKVAIVYGIAQGLEGAVISPRIVGESVGLHPVWIVLSLAAGGFFFGFVGLLIGVPAAVVVKLLIQRGLDRYKASEMYLGTEANRPE